MSEIIADIFCETLIKSGFKETRTKFVPSDTIENEIKNLNNCTINELQQKWKEVSNQPVPEWNRSFFIPRLANQLQIIYYNREISLETQKQLEALYLETNIKAPVAPKRKKRSLKIPQPFKIGQVVYIQTTKRTESFVVLQEGFLYKNKTYKYLKNVLKAATGLDIELKDLTYV